MTAMHFVWARPKNAYILASSVDICRNYAVGERIWKWIKRVRSLKERKIKTEKMGSIDEIYTISSDGVDFRLWERKHPDFNIDKGACSHKFKACAAKYLLALSLTESSCVFMSGPYPGGVSDRLMMEKSGLQDLLLQHNKVAMLDRGFHTKDKLHRATHAYPDEIDPPDLHNFKSRARLRHETFNRRLRHFSLLLNTFTHGFENHQHAFEAVVVIVQYQMENGSPLFCI